MATQTTGNLKLSKPDGTDKVKEFRAPYNSNLDKIDEAVSAQSAEIGDLTDLETTVKTDLVSAINETLSGMQLIKNTVYQGNVITNTVPSRQATIVRSFTLPTGTYLIIGCVIYDQDFSEFTATTLLSGGYGFTTVRGTGSNGGEGIPLVNVITLNENTQIALRALQYSATDEPINTSTTFLRAIKLI